MNARAWLSVVTLCLINAGCVTGTLPRSEPVASSEDQQAIERARASVRWATEFQCPSLGFIPVVEGMQTPDQVTARRTENWEFANGRLQAIRHAQQVRQEALRQLATMKQATPSDTTKRQLDKLDADIYAAVARASSALTTWMLGNWVEMAQIDAAFAYPATGPNPLGRFLTRDQELNALVSKFERLPGKSEFLDPLTPKFKRCLLVTQNQIAERNADSIYAALNTAQTSDDASRIIRPYAVVDSSFTTTGVPTPKAIQAVNDKVAALKEAERRRAEEEAARRRAEQEARRRAESGRDVHPFPSAVGQGGGSVEAQLRTASGLVQALSNRAVDDALVFMHDDVVMSSPAGQQHGKQQVGSTLRQGFASGGGGSVGQPYVTAGNQVVADVRSQRGTARMVFEFRGDRVSRLRVVR